MLDPQQLYVACRFDSASKTDIESFIQSVVESGEEYDNRLFEAHSNDLRVARAKLMEFIEISFSIPRIDSSEGLAIRRAELKRQIGQLLDRSITPYSFCQFFNSMESELVLNSNLDLFTDDVAFLGDLYNACDWCDDTWTIDNSPYLVEEADRVVFKIEKQNKRM